MSGITQKDCADRLGMSARHLRNLVRDGHLPAQDADARHPWPATRDAYNAYLRAQAEAKTAPTDLEDWKTRKLAAEAEREELALAREKADAISRDVFVKVVGEIGDGVRGVCLALPATFGLDLERLGVSADAAEAALEAIGARIMDNTREAIAGALEAADAPPPVSAPNDSSDAA